MSDDYELEQEALSRFRRKTPRNGVLSEAEARALAQEAWAEVHQEHARKRAERTREEQLRAIALEEFAKLKVKRKPPVVPIASPKPSDGPPWD